MCWVSVATASYRGVPGSYLGLETGYHHSSLSWFSSILSGKCCIKVCHDRLLPDPFQLFTIQSKEFFALFHSFSQFKVNDTKDGGWILDASAHQLSRALVSQSASDSWCIKYSVTSTVKQTPFLSVCLSVCTTRLGPCRTVEWRHSMIVFSGIVVIMCTTLKTNISRRSVVMWSRAVSCLHPCSWTVVDATSRTSDEDLICSYFLSTFKWQEARGVWENSRQLNFHDLHTFSLRFNIVCYLYRVMSLKESKLGVCLSKQFNYSCCTDLQELLSSGLRFKSLPLTFHAVCTSVIHRLSVCSDTILYTVTRKHSSESTRKLPHQLNRRLDLHKSGNVHSAGVHIFLKRVLYDFPDLCRFSVCLFKMQIRCSEASELHCWCRAVRSVCVLVFR
jgi:hypothetical protein